MTLLIKNIDAVVRSRYHRIPIHIFRIGYKKYATDHNGYAYSYGDFNSVDEHLKIPKKFHTAYNNMYTINVVNISLTLGEL
jgi:hypothetical protein